MMEEVTKACRIAGGEKITVDKNERLNVVKNTNTHTHTQHIIIVTEYCVFKIVTTTQTLDYNFFYTTRQYNQNDGGIIHIC